MRVGASLHYDSCLNMSANAIVCDGCGQSATPEHLTRRFKRLEETTRFRPLHIQTVFLSDVSPLAEPEFLYSQVREPFRGEALALLKALEMELQGKSREMALTELQRRGCLLTHVLECPVEQSEKHRLPALVDSRLVATITRLNRSLRPKRLVLIAPALAPYQERLRQAGLDPQIVLDGALAIPALGG